MYFCINLPYDDLGAQLKISLPWVTINICPWMDWVPYHGTFSLCLGFYWDFYSHRIWISRFFDLSITEET
jgi:hypothetical protein